MSYGQCDRHLGQFGRFVEEIWWNDEFMSFAAGVFRFGTLSDPGFGDKELIDLGLRVYTSLTLYCFAHFLSYHTDIVLHHPLKHQRYQHGRGSLRRLPDRAQEIQMPNMRPTIVRLTPRILSLPF